MSLICDPCETVAHCMRHGCIPITHEAPAHNFTVLSDDVARMALEIADETMRTTIECKAARCLSTWPAPVYDVTRLEPGHITDDEIVQADRRDIERAVRYLDLRGLLVRPVAGSPHYVSFGRV